MTELKFYLVSPNGPTSEVQRITALHSGSFPPYLFVFRKIKELFPIVESETFKIYWKDEDGDEISIKSDDGVAMATKYMSPSGVVKLYVKLDGTCDTVHMGIKCDGCKVCPVVGYRFKCMECVNYDLCAACERNGVHNEHRLTQISTFPAKLGATRKVHHDVQCNGCEMSPIVGYRFQCEECLGYDLCGTCKSGGVYHQHRLTLCLVPK